jgi:hypothetical protein
MLLSRQNPVMDFFCANAVWSRGIDRCLTVATVTFITVLVGWSSRVEAQTPSPTTVPPAETINAEEVRRYARAGLMIENARRQLEQEIGRDRIQGLSCHEVPIMRGVDPAIVQSCQKFGEFVSSSELGQDRFNLIYTKHQKDVSLAQRILTEMARLCLETGDSLSPSFCQDTVRPQMQRQCNANKDVTPAEICDRLRQPIPEN